ncbi:MAG: DNA recombination protein RmuC [Psychrobacter glaciei]|jgi:DNA recombination protein RmuC
MIFTRQEVKLGSYITIFIRSHRETMFALESLILPALITVAFASALLVLQRMSKRHSDMLLGQANEQKLELQQQLHAKTQDLSNALIEMAALQTKASDTNTAKALAEASDATTKQQLLSLQSLLTTSEQKLDTSRAELSLVQGQLKHTQATLLERELDAQKLIKKESQIDQLNLQVAELNTQLNQEKVERQKDQENLDEKLQLLQTNKAQLSQEFENLSNKIFEEKNKQFKLSSQEGLTSLLMPFKDQLEGLRKKVDDVYVAESKDRSALKEQITSLHDLNKQITEEAASLARALRGEKKTQGNWGELVLETVLEKSGLRQGAEYVREKSITDEIGERFRPDVIINLPEEKHIVVDAKVSLNAYTDYVNAESEVDRVKFLKQHIDAVRMHIKSLSEKSYSKLPGINSPDFVFMFMPIEPAFMVAFEHDDQLFNDAFEKRIVVVTPTTLLASLRTVSSLWSIERQNKNAKQLAEQAGKVHAKLVSFVEDMEKIGKQLGTVQGTYDNAWNKLKEGRGNLISQAHKFKDLGVRVKKEIPQQVLDTAELEFAEEAETDVIADTDK